MEVLVFLLGILLGFAFGEVWVWVTDKWSAKPFIKGYHLHHSLFALLVFFIAFFVSETMRIVLLGSGIGIIIQHTCKEGFKFITRE